MNLSSAALTRVAGAGGEDEGHVAASEVQSKEGGEGHSTLLWL